MIKSEGIPRLNAGLYKGIALDLLFIKPKFHTIIIKQAMCTYAHKLTSYLLYLLQNSFKVFLLSASSKKYTTILILKIKLTLSKELTVEKLDENMTIYNFPHTHLSAYFLHLLLQGIKKRLVMFSSLGYLPILLIASLNISLLLNNDSILLVPHKNVHYFISLNYLNHYDIQ